MNVRLGFKFSQLEVGTHTMAYIDEGAGPVVLLLHGAPMTSLGFIRVIRGLRSRYRVLAPDLPGFGFSSAGPDFSGRLDEYAQAIARFCEALELRNFYAFVHDSSACVGLAAFCKLPVQPAGVIVSDTVPIPLTGRAWAIKMILRHVMGATWMRWINRRWNLLPWAVVRLAPMFKPFSKEEREAMLAQFEAPASRDRILELFAQMGRSDGFMRALAQQLQEKLAQVPALILFGQLDPMRICGGVARWRRYFLRSEVCIIPREEHFPILGSGEVVAQAIDRWIQSDA